METAKLVDKRPIRGCSTETAVLQKILLQEAAKKEQEPTQYEDIYSVAESEDDDIAQSSDDGSPCSDSQNRGKNQGSVEQAVLQSILRAQEQKMAPIQYDDIYSIQDDDDDDDESIASDASPVNHRSKVEQGSPAPESHKPSVSSLNAKVPQAAENEELVPRRPSSSSDLKTEKRPSSRGPEGQTKIILIKKKSTEKRSSSTGRKTSRRKSDSEKRTSERGDGSVSRRKNSSSERRSSERKGEKDNRSSERRSSERKGEKDNQTRRKSGSEKVPNGRSRSGSAHKSPGDPGRKSPNNHQHNSSSTSRDSKRHRQHSSEGSPSRQKSQDCLDSRHRKSGSAKASAKSPSDRKMERNESLDRRNTAQAPRRSKSRSEKSPSHSSKSSKSPSRDKTEGSMRHTPRKTSGGSGDALGRRHSDHIPIRQKSGSEKRDARELRHSVHLAHHRTSRLSSQVNSRDETDQPPLANAPIERSGILRKHTLRRMSSGEEGIPSPKRQPSILRKPSIGYNQHPNQAELVSTSSRDGDNRRPSLLKKPSFDAKPEDSVDADCIQKAWGGGNGSVGSTLSSVSSGENNVTGLQFDPTQDSADTNAKQQNCQHEGDQINLLLQKEEEEEEQSIATFLDDHDDDEKDKPAERHGSLMSSRAEDEDNCEDESLGDESSGEEDLLRASTQKTVPLKKPMRAPPPNFDDDLEDSFRDDFSQYSAKEVVSVESEIDLNPLEFPDEIPVEDDDSHEQEEYEEPVLMTPLGLESPGANKQREVFSTHPFDSESDEEESEFSDIEPSASEDERLEEEERSQTQKYTKSEERKQPEKLSGTDYCDGCGSGSVSRQEKAKKPATKSPKPRILRKSFKSMRRAEIDYPSDSESACLTEGSRRKSETFDFGNVSLAALMAEDESEDESEHTNQTGSKSRKSGKGVGRFLIRVVRKARRDSNDSDAVSVNSSKSRRSKRGRIARKNSKKHARRLND